MVLGGNYKLNRAKEGVYWGFEVKEEAGDRAYTARQRSTHYNVSTTTGGGGEQHRE